MADSEGSVDRLEDLRGRWEDNPTSRVFVQLAQEYRRRGEVAEALEVLESGLVHHPAYQSAKVALARCQLDLDRPEDALESLRSVLEKDPTHLLAGKLVVEAHLASDDRDAAREALDRYRLLGAPEEEVEELLLRLDAARERPARPRPPAAEPALGTRGAEAPRDAGSGPRGEVFTLPPRRVEPSLPWSRGNGGDRRQLRGATDRSPWAFEGPALEERYLRGLAGDVLAPGGAAPEERAREESLPAERPEAFEDAVAAEAAPETAEAAEALEPLEISEPSAPSEPRPPVAEDELSMPRKGAPPPAAPAEPDAPSAATVTLGDLYLRQGHAEEAETIYREVLRREPGHAGARRGLETIELRLRSWIPAKELLEEAPERPEGLTATKRALLERYLARLKRGGGHDVSRPTS